MIWYNRTSILVYCFVVDTHWVRLKDHILWSRSLKCISLPNCRLQLILKGIPWLIITMEARECQKEELHISQPPRSLLSPHPPLHRSMTLHQGVVLASCPDLLVDHSQCAYGDHVNLRSRRWIIGEQQALTGELCGKLCIAAHAHVQQCIHLCTIRIQRRVNGRFYGLI